MLQHFDTLLAFSLVLLMLSLMVLVLVQMVSVGLQRRGRNLRWGVTLLLKQMGVTDDARAQKLATAILKHPAVSASGVTYAQAITPEALKLLLHDVSKKGCEAEQMSVIAALWSWLVDWTPGSTRTFESLPTVKKKRKKKQEEDAHEEAPVVDANRAAAMEPVKEDALTVLAALGEGPVGAAVTSTLESASQQAVTLRKQGLQWFEMVMNQTTDRFTAQTRGVTIVLSFVIAFVFQIDALELLHKLSTNEELRSAIVATANSQMAQAEDTLELAEANSKLAGEVIVEVLSRDDVGSGELRESLRNSLPDDGGLKTEREWTAWLDEHKPASARPADMQAILDAYAAALDVRRAELEGQLQTTALRLKEQLDALDLKLLETGRPWPADTRLWWRHFAGIVMTALLLSLGAPFWFKLLRNMIKMRPVVAEQMDQPKAKGGKKAGGGEPAPAEGGAS